MYDMVAGRQCLKPSYVLSKTRTLEIFPMLKKEKLVGGIVYYDGKQNITACLVGLGHLHENKFVERFQIREMCKWILHLKNVTFYFHDIYISATSGPAIIISQFSASVVLTANSYWSDPFGSLTNPIKNRLPAQWDRFPMQLTIPPVLYCKMIFNIPIWYSKFDS